MYPISSFCFSFIFIRVVIFRKVSSYFRLLLLQAIEELRAIDVEEFNEAKASKLLLSTVTESKKKKQTILAVEKIVLSPLTGRPQRSMAGKNKYID